MADIPTAFEPEEDGFVEVYSEDGVKLRIFVLSAEKLNALRPTAETYRRVAAMMLASEKTEKPPLLPLSNKQRIQQVLKRS